MKKTLVTSLAMLAIVLAAADPVAATELSLITGAESGTYHRVGHDLRKLLRSSGIKLTIQASRGPVDNIFAVHRGAADLGIVQSDVIEFISMTSSRTLAGIARNTRMVFPLYDEVVHVVGRAGIQTFEDLDGKRVAIGQEGTGGHLTSALLFKLSAIKPAETVAIGPGDAIRQLRAGRLDAMIYVAGLPVQQLRTITTSDGLALIPVTSKSVLEAYAPAEIPANVYGWQSSPVSTVSVKALLVSLDSRDAKCESVGRLAREVAAGFAWLTTHGHPRWKTVDLDMQLPGWERHQCAQQHFPLARPAPARDDVSASGR